MECTLSAKRNGNAAKRFFKKMLKDTPLLAPDRVGTDGYRAFSGAINVSVNEGLLPKDLTHYVTKHLQQGIESDHFRVKKPRARSGGFQSFNTARRTIKFSVMSGNTNSGTGFSTAINGKVVSCSSPKFCSRIFLPREDTEDHGVEAQTT